MPQYSDSPRSDPRSQSGIVQLHRITCKKIASWHRPHHIHIRTAPVGVLRRTRRVLLLYQLRKKHFSSLRFIYKSITIYIFIENDLYIKRKRFIYKLKPIYIQVVVRLVLIRISVRESSFPRGFCLVFLFSADAYSESFQTHLCC